jgi:hypothetical protein
MSLPSATFRPIVNPADVRDRIELTWQKDTAMPQDDREWYWKDRKRREELVWNEKRGELEFDSRRRRSLLGLPGWLRETFRFLGYLAATLLAPT